MSNKILITDDETAFWHAVGKYLMVKGFDIDTAHDGVEALELCKRQVPDLVLLDIEMPKLDGLECLKRIKKNYPETEVIMVTGFADSNVAEHCLQEGAFGYLTKPPNLKDLYIEIGQALEHRKLILEKTICYKCLEKHLEERTDESLLPKEQQGGAFLNTVKTLVNLLEIYNPFLAGHSKRVAFWAREIARELGLEEDEIYELEIAGMLHDLGVVAIPTHINQKPFSELTERQQKIVRQHPIFSQKILESSKGLKKVGIIIRHHLERLDGTGYPDGLTDKEIPLGSKILSVANAFDELVSRRRFTKEVFSSENEKFRFAFLDLCKFMGQRFQKEVVEALERVQIKFLKPKTNVVEMAVEKLEPGMILAADVNTPYGTVFLAEGTKLDEFRIIQLISYYRIEQKTEGIPVYKKV